MKACSCCGLVKPADEFQVRKASHDGLTASCRMCLKKRDAERYIKERWIRSARHKKYMATPGGKAAHKKAISLWQTKNSLRRAANVILGNAIRSGKVKKQPCHICGSIAEAHHPDYDRPLDVVWLCSFHHKQAHALISLEDHEHYAV